MSNFNMDLDFGIEKEKEILKFLSNEDDVVEHMTNMGKFTDYDYVINDITYEQKTDRFTHKTGNLCIEMRNKNGEETGLLSTKAQCWVHYVIGGKRLIIIPVSVLKRLCGNYLVEVGYDKAIRFLGDSHKVECMLLPESRVPRQYFRSYCPCLI